MSRFELEIIDHNDKWFAVIRDTKDDDKQVWCSSGYSNKNTLKWLAGIALRELEAEHAS